MLKRLARRLAESFVLGFAALGFFYVPLGERTGFEHAQAIAKSPEVQEFAVELVEAVQALRARLRHRLLEAVGAPPPAMGVRIAPVRAEASRSNAPVGSRREHGGHRGPPRSGEPPRAPAARR